MMRRTALLLVGALALINAKFITRGDDSNVLACDVCADALTDAGSHALAFAPACGAAFDAAALSQCRHLARDDEQAGVCAQTFASHCATVLNETSAAVGIDGAFDALHTCAVLGAAGSACENVAATAAFAIETASAPRGLAVTADIAASAVKLNIPARFMWGWAEDVNGYCGETSIQASGLFFGNYFSQEQVRYAAGNAEVLIDINAHGAVANLKMTYTRWDINGQPNPQGANFVKWVKTQIDKGAPVVFGGYLKEARGDADYDHIMLMTGYAGSGSTVSEVYYDDLWLPNDRTLKNPGDVLTRKQCTQSSTPQQPFTYCLPSAYVSGIAITGNVDKKGETYRTQLDIGRWDEPDWGAEDGVHEKPVALYPTATVSGLTAGANYALLRFDEAGGVPSSNFLAGSWATKVEFTASGATQKLTGLDAIQSDGTYFYRCVAV